jgi:hypothetical protein
MQNDLQAEIGTDVETFLIYLIVGPGWRRRFLRAISREGVRGKKGLFKEQPRILEVEICKVTNQTKAVFDATASIYDADRSRLIPGLDTFYRWAIDCMCEICANRT